MYATKQNHTGGYDDDMHVYVCLCIRWGRLVYVKASESVTSCVHDRVAIDAISKFKHLQASAPIPRPSYDETQDLESVNRRAAALMHKQNLQEQAHDGHLGEPPAAGPHAAPLLQK